MRLLRFLGILIVLGLVATIAIGVYARFSDGPIAVFAGGPLQAGTPVREPVEDWSFVDPVQEIDFQLLTPPRSRTVWIVSHEGRAYIPCGFVNVPLWKQWPQEALADGRAVLRIEGKLYEVTLTREGDGALFETLGELIARKYGVPDGYGGDADSVWFFRVESRT